MDTFEFIEVSDFACDSYGYTREEFLGMQIFDVAVNPPLVSKIRDKFQEISSGEVFEFFGYHRRKDGTIFPAHIRLTVMDDNFALAFVRDISVIEDQASLVILRNRLIRKDKKMLLNCIKYQKENQKYCS